MVPFSKLVRMFVGWVGEKSSVKREQTEKKSAELGHFMSRVGH